MAKKYQTTDAKGPDDPMAAMRKRFAVCEDLWTEPFGESAADVRFTFKPGEQWDVAMKANRGTRPKYEFNKTRPAVKAVTNDMRQNNPAIKVRASEDGHKELADIMNGLIRNIEAQSQADTAYDTAGFFAAAGGYGVFAFDTEYSNDDMFEQDIRVVEMRNPFSVKFGPAKKFDKRDARYLFVEDSLDTEEFKHLYPDARLADFEGGSVGKYGDWFREKKVRVAWYWCKHHDTKTIYQLSDGRVLDEDDYQAMLPSLGQPGPNGEPPLTLKNQRVVKFDRIERSLVSGAEVLDGPYPWAGKFFPFVPVWGESVNIEGEEIFQGIARPIKDSQRLFNWNVCTGMEVMANQPKAPYLYTPAMIEGHEAEWRGLNTENAPGLPYNVDPTAPGMKPIREQPPQFPAALFNGAQFASDLIKSVSNVVDAPIQSRAASGKAIQAVENQQDVGNFDYIDNLARAKAFGGEILIDLIPRIYDTEREIMILGEDGKESYAKLNQTVPHPDKPGEWQVINDLSQGKYACVVTVGPSYATRRQETVQALTQIASNPNPQVAALATYGIIKNMDEPGLQDVEAAMRKMLIGQGLLEPGEGDAPPPQAPGPNPKDLADAALKAAQAENYQAKTAETKVNTAITVQHAPLVAMQEAAKTEMHTVDAYTKDPNTPYFGPPAQGLPPQ